VTKKDEYEERTEYHDDYYVCGCCGTIVPHIDGYEFDESRLDLDEWKARYDALRPKLDGTYKEQSPEYLDWMASVTVTLNMYLEKRRQEYSKAVTQMGRSRQDQEKSSFVYFIQGVSGGPIKIGISVDPERRIQNITYPEPLKTLLIIPGDTSDEARLHKVFSHLRLEREWFRDDPELIQFIEWLKKHDGQTPLL